MRRQMNTNCCLCCQGMTCVMPVDCCAQIEMMQPAFS